MATGKSMRDGHPSTLHVQWAWLLLAVEVCNTLKKESPNIFHDIEIYEESDGMPAVRVAHSKV